MSRLPEADVYVVGAGPNGLSAAIEMARAGYQTILVERAETIGGGVRSAQLTRPGFVHDVCAAVFPLGIGSPFLEQLPLADYGLRWVHAPVVLAHVLEGGKAVLLDSSIQRTAAGLGQDGDRYLQLMEPLLRDWHKLLEDVLSPLYWPSHPIVLARFAQRAMHSAKGLADAWFGGRRARALVAGLAAHSMLPLDSLGSGAFALVLGVLGHAVGWPFVQGGAQNLTDALADIFGMWGGQIVTGRDIRSLSHLPRARAALLDVSPRQLVKIAGWWLPRLYRRQLASYRYGPGVFKIDWALDGPIPWQAEECLRAGTVHIGGTFEEVAGAEKAVWLGQHPDRPFIILSQPSLFDSTRCPVGAHTAWAYCHVPNGSRVDMAARIEGQIERLAPGFRRRITGRHTRTAAQHERENPNCVGGDINGGLADIRQLFTRPAVRHDPYSTPVRDLYICSASTPPGGGVHGMCGYYAAQTAIRCLQRQERKVEPEATASAR
jgi:phytoene dehydrogenase-like protein